MSETVFGVWRLVSCEGSIKLYADHAFDDHGTGRLVEYVAGEVTNDILIPSGDRIKAAKAIAGPDAVILTGAQAEQWRAMQEPTSEWLTPICGRIVDAIPLSPMFVAPKLSQEEMSLESYTTYRRQFIEEICRGFCGWLTGIDER